MPEKNNSARLRSARAEVRNPALALPAIRALQSLAPDIRQLLSVLLYDLRRDARSRAEKCWSQRKAFMAAYWSVVAVYAAHFARALCAGSRRPSPFLVRQEGFPDYTARDWPEASRLFCERRDLFDLGASRCPDAVMLVGELPIARISYNGRVWPLKAWEPNQQPIFDNRQD